METIQETAALSGINKFAAIRESLRELYLNDPRPWLVGFSGGKDSTMVAMLKVEESRENNLAYGLPAELKRILRDDLACLTT